MNYNIHTICLFISRFIYISDYLYYGLQIYSFFGRSVNIILAAVILWLPIDCSFNLNQSNVAFSSFHNIASNFPHGPLHSVKHLINFVPKLLSLFSWQGNEIACIQLSQAARVRIFSPI